MENSNTSGCPNTQNIILMGVNNQDRKALFFHPSCGQWSCEYCGQINKEKWLHVAQRGAQILIADGQMLQFLTLTMPGYATPASSIYFFRKNWPKLHEKAKYHTNKWADVTGTEWAYFCVPERHKSGVAHWHLLCTTWLDTDRWWKDNGHKAGFGYMNEIKVVETSGQAVGYVTKYLHKDAGGIQWPKGFQRVRTNGKWPKSKIKVDENWKYCVVSENGKFIEKGSLLNLGYEVIDRTEE